MDINKLLRSHLVDLKPYSSARDEFQGEADVYLDANENAFGSMAEERYRRYPDPYQWALKHRLAAIKGISAEQIFLGNGSDEPIDLLIRAFCNPGKDRIIITPPTYGMYEVSAGINDIGIIRVPLIKHYSLDLKGVIEAIEPGVKLVFLCSPNNPTGNSIARENVLRIAQKIQGLVVLDEAYIDFSPNPSLLPDLAKQDNLVILQTLSKAWGLASLRLGMLFASTEIVQVLNKIKPPYNINGATQEIVLNSLQNTDQMKSMVQMILSQKKVLVQMLSDIPLVQDIFPSDANFLLVKMDNAHDIYEKLIKCKVIVRDRSNVELCENCLRITVGNEQENQRLVHELKQLEA